MSGKVIFAVSNCDKVVGPEGKKSGSYLPEVAQPYDVLSKAGFDITFVSPTGGKGPIDEFSREAFKEDPSCKEFVQHHESKLEKTLTPSAVNPGDFKALFYPGGYGPMFDLPDNTEIAELARQIYEQGGVLGAVCHGTVGFVPINLSSGEPLVKGKIVTSFTKSEETHHGFENEVPFPLETRLEELGAKFVAAADLAEHVQIDQRLVTGQNPASATKVAEEMVKLLK